VQQEALRRAIEQDPSLLAQHPELHKVAQAAEAEAVKARGNTAFAAGKFEEAVALFTRCIELDGGNHIYYSNRAAAHTGLKDYRAAARDAARCTQLRPQWAKGWSRLGAAHFGLEEFSEVRVGAAGRGIALRVGGRGVLLLLVHCCCCWRWPVHSAPRSAC
jgi:tetratricopeptide (TPR) repeat protein